MTDKTIEAMLEAYRTSEFSDDNPPDLSFPLLAMQAAYAVAYDDIRNEVLGEAAVAISRDFEEHENLTLGSNLVEAYGMSRCVAARHIRAMKGPNK